MPLTLEREIKFLTDEVNKLSNTAENIQHKLDDPVVDVRNLDEIKKHLRDELKIISNSVISAITNIKSDNKVDLSTMESQLGGINGAINDLKAITAKIDFSPEFKPEITLKPDIKVEAPKIPHIKIPDINVPEAKITVNPTKIDIAGLIKALMPLQILSNNPKKPLSVRMSDGMEWLKQIAQEVEKSSKTMTAFATTGMSADEWKGAYKQVTIYTKFKHGSKSSIGTSEVQLATGNQSASNGILVKAANDNTGTLYIGNTGVTAGTTDTTDGYELMKGESVVMPIDNANKIYVIASEASQKAYWMAV